MTATTAPDFRAFGRLLTTAGLCAFGLILLAAWPVHMASGQSGASNMIAGVMAALIGSAASLWLPFGFGSGTVSAFAMASLASLGVRFLATLAVGFVVIRAGLAAGDAFWLWLAAAQLLLLAVDTAGLIRLVRAWDEAQRAKEH